MFKELFNIKLNKGVTLVALIVTIIVLLILAGVTINAIVGGNGTVEKASESKTVTENSNNKALVEDAVASAMGKEKGTILHLDTLTNAIGNVGTVAQEGQYFNVTIQNYKYWVTPEGEVSIERPIRIGDIMSYSTLLNNVTLNNWKVFYKETKDGTSYTWLILEDYLQNSAISSEIKTNYNLENRNGDYTIQSTTNRADLINSMTTTSNWSSLLTGTLNGKSIDYSSSQDENIKAMGSPTLDLYVNSWNKNYPSNPIYIAKKTDMTDSIGWGYYIGNSENPSTAYASISRANSDTLYYPHTSYWNSAGGYWLASPSANYTNSVLYVNSNGTISADYYGNASFAFRPVICLPSSAFE